MFLAGFLFGGVDVLEAFLQPSSLPAEPHGQAPMVVGLAPRRSGTWGRGAHRCSSARWLLGPNLGKMGQNYLAGLKALQILVAYGDIW